MPSWPTPPDSRADPVAPPAESPLKELPALAAKRALIEKIKLQRETASRIENAFVDAARTIHSVEKNLIADPEKTVAEANRLVGVLSRDTL